MTFPLFEKIDVNGPGRHPIYDELTATADAEGAAGDIQWNFEKFLVSPDGADRRSASGPASSPRTRAWWRAVEGALPAQRSGRR